MKRYVAQRLIPFYTHNPGRDNSWTLCIDPQTKVIFKADAKDMDSSKVIFLILIGYPIGYFFPIHFIPINNMMAFIFFSIVIFFLSLLFGYKLSPKMLENYRKITLTSKEWEHYLHIFNQFYFRQLILPTILLVISIACFV